MTSDIPGSRRLESLALMLVWNVPPNGGELDRVEAAVKGGVTWVQVRGKNLSARDLANAVTGVLPLCRSRSVPVYVNDRADVALATGADGVHLGPDDLPPSAARRIMGSLGLGLTARDRARLVAGEPFAVDYFGCGALRTTSTKPDARVLGVEGILALAAATAFPVVAIGGVRPKDVSVLRRGGVAGVAVSSGILGTPDPEAAAKSYREAWTD